jgi:hypothetical protein
MSISKMEKLQRPLRNMASLSSSKLKGLQIRGMQTIELASTKARLYEVHALYANTSALRSHTRESGLSTQCDNRRRSAKRLYTVIVHL